MLTTLGAGHERSADRSSRLVAALSAQQPPVVTPTLMAFFLRRAPCLRGWIEHGAEGLEGNRSGRGRFRLCNTMSSMNAATPAQDQPQGCATVALEDDGADFSRYALIIDARSPHEYLEDHVPGAVNLPVVDDNEFAQVGVAHVENPHAAYVIGAAYASKNLARHIQSHISRCRPSDRILVYCFRGGKRSRVWGDTLRNIGFATDVMPGGWKAYRAWVRQGLGVLPLQFSYRVLSSLTGCGKTRLLQALQQHGAQVLDLEGLALHRGSLLGSLPGEPQPPQKLFDSLLIARLRSFDRGQPVWIESESKKIGQLQLPIALYDAMRSSQMIELRAPIQARVRLLMEEYPHFAATPHAMVAKLAPLKPLVGSEEIARWAQLADDGQVEQLFERVLLTHYDPSYLRSSRRASHQNGKDALLELQGLDAASMGEAAQNLISQHGRSDPCAPASLV